MARKLDNLVLDERTLKHFLSLKLCLIRSFQAFVTQVLSKKPHQKALMLLLLLSNVGLFIVDHIHFQV